MYLKKGLIVVLIVVLVVIVSDPDLSAIEPAYLFFWLYLTS